MDCLRGYIGLKGCGEETSPASGLYVNSLPYITLKTAADLVNSDQDSVSDLWNDIETRAILRLTDDVTAEFSKRYKLNQVLQTIDLGKVITDSTFVAPDGVQYKGFTADLRPYQGANYKYSSLSVISVQTLAFYATVTDADKVAEVAVFDSITKEKLFTYDLTIGAGWNNVQVNLSFSPASSIFCAIDATDLSTVTTTIDSCLSNEYYGTMRINGASSESDIVLTQSANSNGLTGIFSQTCSFNAIICNNKAQFKRALLYCLGYEYQIEALNSDVLSGTTTIQYVNNENSVPQTLVDYKSALKTAIQGFNLNLNDICLQCNEQFIVKEIIP